MSDVNRHWLERLAAKFPELGSCLEDVTRAYVRLVETYARGGKVLICGNGGSAADADHIVAELMKGYLAKRRVPQDVRERLTELFPRDSEYLADHLQGALPAISLASQTGLITAFANDVAPDMIFAQQVYGYGRAGDALLAISTSGNSKNVVNAVKVARAQGLTTIGLTGASGGALETLCDVAVRVPCESVPEIQERHVAIYHSLCAMLEEKFFPD